MPQLNDLSRSLVILEQDATLIAVIEMGQSSWLVAGIVPGVERSPLKKLAVDESALLKLLACASRIFPSAKALSDIPLIVTAAKRTAKPRITASTARKRDRLW